MNNETDAEATTQEESSSVGAKGSSRRWNPAVPLLVFAMYQSWLVGGIVYGWPALLVMLRREGVYGDECPPGVEDCDARDVALNLVFTLGAAVNVGGALTNGFVIDAVGPRLSIVCGLAMAIAGSLTMAYAEPDSTVAWPSAYIALGLGGGLVHVSELPLGNVFGRARGTAVSCIVAAFSLSAFTFHVGFLVYDLGGLSRQTIFLGHAMLMLANLLFCAWFWPGKSLQMGDKLSVSGFRLEVVRLDGSGQDLVPGAVSDDDEGQPGRVARATLFSLMLSSKYIGFVLFHTVQIWINRCLMGWIQSELQWKDSLLRAAGGAGLDVLRQAEVFNIAQSFIGILTLPLFGKVTAKFGHRLAPFVSTALLGVVWLALNLVAAEWALYLLYCVSTIHRQFFFTTYFLFLIAEFPPHVFGRMAGIASVIAAALIATQNPVLQYTLTDLRGDFAPVLCVQLAIECVVLCIVAAVGVRLRRAPPAAESRPSIEDGRAAS